MSATQSAAVRSEPRADSPEGSFIPDQDYRLTYRRTREQIELHRVVQRSPNFGTQGRGFESSHPDRSINTMDWTVGVSIYAALVATATGLWAAYGIWRDRTSIKVVVRFGYLYHNQTAAWQMSSPQLKTEEVDVNTRLLVTARNVGRRPVVLSNGGIQINGRLQAFTGDGLDKNELPKKLGEGESFDTWTFLLRFRESLRSKGLAPKLKAYWQTEAGDMYTTNVPKNIGRFLLDDEYQP